MKIGLIQVDGSLPNPALMKLSAWHRERGDEVTILDLSAFQFDRTYASKVFVGGSGYDLKSELPPEIEVLTPDYELFKTDYSIGFTTRGCFRDCGFCIVREKEGGLRDVNWDWIRHSKVVLLDNNFLASPTWREKLQSFIKNKVKVSFNQGLDIRLINEENASLLAKTFYYDLKFRRRILYFAFDDPSLEPVIKDKISTLINAGIPTKHLMFYILVGYNTTFKEDYRRFETIRDLGSLPFIQLYNNTRKRILRHFSRWVNKRYYKVVSWEDYLERKERGLESCPPGGYDQ